MESVINPKTSRRYHLMGWGICLTAAILFSSKAIAIKLAYLHEVDAASLLALRMAMALPIYLVLGAIYWRQTPIRRRLRVQRKLPHILMVGLLGYFVASLFDFMGLSYVSAQLERIVLFTYPIWVMIIGGLFFGQTLKKALLLALPLGWLGILVSMLGDWQGAGEEVLIGSALILVSAFSYALYTLMARGFIQQLGGGIFTSVAMSGAAVGSVLYALVKGPLLSTQWPLEVYGYAFYMAVFATVIPSYLFSEAVKRLGSDVAASSSSIGPIATSVMAVMVLGEPFGFWQLLGLLLVLTSVACLSRSR